MIESMKGPITPEQFAAEMAAFADRDGPDDPEFSHVDADELMCKVLRSLGYHEGVEVFRRMKKFYT